VQKKFRKIIKKKKKKKKNGHLRMVIKPINFQSSPNYSDPTFYLGMKAIPKVSSYIYLGIPFFFFQMISSY